MKIEINNDYINYKDTETLKKFLNTHAGMQSRRRTGVPSHIQRSVEQAIKRARFMGLIPYVSR